MKKPSPSFLRATFRYDAETGFLWWRERGHGRRFSKPAGSMGPKGYIHVEISGIPYKAHHIIWAMVKDRWPVQIDHKNNIEKRLKDLPGYSYWWNSSIHSQQSDINYGYLNRSGQENICVGAKQEHSHSFFREPVKNY